MLECLPLETLSSWVLEIEGKARANIIGGPSDASFLGKLLLFPAIVRLDWKMIASTNTLAYLASSTVTKEKHFITLTPGVNVINIFFFVKDIQAIAFVPGKP